MKPDLSVIGNNASSAWYRAWLPDEGRLAIRHYQDMRDTDPVIGGTFLALESLFRQVEWNVTPADDSPEAMKWAEFLRTCREDLSHSFPGFLAEVLTMLPHGWSYFEQVWKIRGGPDQADAARRSAYSDGLIGWRKFAFRPQNTLSRWEYDGDGGIQGMWQNTARGQVLIPIQKALHFRTTDAGGHPEGRSLLLNSRRAYRFQTKLEELEAVGVERDFAGLPVIQVPPALLEIDPNPVTEEEQQNAAAKLATLEAIKRMGAGVRNDEQAYILFPSETYIVEETDPTTRKTVSKELSTGYKFSLATSGGTRAHDTDTIIKRYSQRIATSMLSTFLLLGGSEGGGAKALSADLTDLFQTAGEGTLDSVTDVMNRFAVSALMRLNGVPPALWPKLAHGGLTKDSISGLVERLKLLLDSGAITPDSSLEADMRRRLKLPGQDDPKSRSAPPSP